MKKDLHVTKRPDGQWQVIRENADRASSVHETQHGAIEQAKETAKREGLEVVIHGRDNKIRDSDSYGKDPAPPVDKKH